MRGQGCAANATCKGGGAGGRRRHAAVHRVAGVAHVHRVVVVVVVAAAVVRVGAVRHGRDVLGELVRIAGEVNCGHSHGRGAKEAAGARVGVREVMERGRRRRRRDTVHTNREWVHAERGPGQKRLRVDGHLAAVVHAVLVVHIRLLVVKVAVAVLVRHAWVRIAPGCAVRNVLAIRAPRLAVVHIGEVVRVQMVAQFSHALAREDTEDAALVIRELCDAKRKKKKVSKTRWYGTSIRGGGITRRGFPAEFLQVLPQKGLDAGQAQMRETETRVEEFDDALWCVVSNLRVTLVCVCVCVCVATESLDRVLTRRVRLVQ